MANPVDSLPADVVEAWKSGNKIEAIKRLREATNLGLAEAKAAIDALDHAEASPLAAAMSARLAGGASLPEMMKALQESGALPPDVMEAWQRGDKLGALKRFAAAAKEGRIQNVKVKVTVNERDSRTAALASSSPAPRPTPAGNSMRSETLAPGEVPRSKSGATAALVLIAIVVIALVIYARFG